MTTPRPRRGKGMVKYWILIPMGESSALSTDSDQGSEAAIKP
jgi:hypothetical protein